MRNLKKLMLIMLMMGLALSLVPISADVRAANIQETAAQQTEPNEEPCDCDNPEAAESQSVAAKKSGSGAKTQDSKTQDAKGRSKTEQTQKSSVTLTPGVIDETKQITIRKLPNDQLEYTYRVINDIELRGINGESSWYFLVEKGMKATYFKFNLYCRMNELIKPNISYFTVYMNDLPIKSMRIKDVNGTLMNQWEIVIPTRTINVGYNELKVRSHTRITDEPCEDDKNIANWVIIDGKTNYVAHFRKDVTSGGISNFTRPFVSMHADDAPGIGVVIPDQHNDKELSAALTLIAHMRYSGSAFEVPSTLIKAGDVRVADFDSLIYVGNYKSVPEALKGVIRTQPSLYTDTAHIYRSTLDKGRKPVLMIVSDNGDRLMEAVKSLKNSDIKIQMNRKYQKLKPHLDTTIKEQRVSDYIYLKDLGINGIEVKGRNLQVATIGIRIPTNQMLANDAKLVLNVRYSDNLDFEKSYVTVYINGIPSGSHRLVRELRNRHTMTFYVPDELRRKTYFDVRIVFEMISDGIIDCKRNLASTPWAYIIEDSYYFFPKQERYLKLLNNLPFPFSRNDDLDPTTIVMPDNPTRDDYWIAGKIAALAGIGVKNNEGVIDAVKGSKLGSKSQVNNLVIFGTPGENRAIKQVNSYLWFKYNKQFNTVLSNEKIELLPETAKTATFMEIKTSPYNHEKGMMTITSLDKKSLMDALVYLENDRRGFLTGDAAIISKDGELQNFRFQKDEDMRPEVNKPRLANKNLWNLLKFAVALLLFLGIGLGFYLYKNKRKKD